MKKSKTFLLPVIIILLGFLSISCEHEALVGGSVLRYPSDTPIEGLELGLYKITGKGEDLTRYDQLVLLESTRTNTQGEFLFSVDDEVDIQRYLYLPVPINDTLDINSKYMSYPSKGFGLYTASWGINKKILLKPAVKVHFTLSNITLNDSLNISDAHQSFSQTIIDLPAKCTFPLIPGEVNELKVHKYQNDVLVLEKTLEIYAKHHWDENRMSKIFSTIPDYSTQLTIP